MIVDKMTIYEVLAEFKKDLNKIILPRISQENKVYARKKTKVKNTERIYFRPIEIKTQNGFNIVIRYYKRSIHEKGESSYGCHFFSWFLYQKEIWALDFSSLYGLQAPLNLYTPHMFMRYNERFLKNDKLSKSEIILRFFQNNRNRWGKSCPSEEYPLSAYMFCNDGVCLCDVEDSMNTVFRTFLSWDMLGLDEKKAAVEVRNLAIDVKQLDIAIPDFEFDEDAYKRGKKKGLQISQKTFASLSEKDRSKTLEQYADIQYEVARGYRFGDEQLRDLKKAAEYDMKAAEMGNSLAQHDLGYCYYIGEGTPRDYTRALHWFMKAAEQDNADSQYNVGCIYANGQGVSKDYTEAAKWFKKAADNGSMKAQIAIAKLYDAGLGVIKDIKQAMFWYEKAAMQGDRTALNTLWIRYHDGLGIARDYQRAVKWLQIAVQHNEPGAQYMLGKCFYGGNGVVKNYAEAVKWYRLSAEQGFVMAQHDLGYCYLCGHGIPQDDIEAFKYFTLAAEQGYEDAQNCLGMCYVKGKGVEKDYAKAEYWFQKAIQQGNFQSRVNLVNLLVETKRLDEALPLAKILFEENQNTEMIQKLYFGILIELGRIKEAQQLYNKFVKNKKR